MIETIIILLLIIAMISMMMLFSYDGKYKQQLEDYRFNKHIDELIEILEERHNEESK